MLFMTLAMLLLRRAEVMALWFPVLGISVAVVWQVSAFKQPALNLCHRRPALQAFGPETLRDAAIFGVRNAVACIESCWALMFAALATEFVHTYVMICVVLFALAERLERPAPAEWRLRGIGKSVRILASQIRRCASGHDGSSS